MAKVLIPPPQKLQAIGGNDTRNFTQLQRREVQTANNRNALDPEFRGLVIFVHMYMRGLAELLAVEIKPIAL
jgi:hypothetical protein